MCKKRCDVETGDAAPANWFIFGSAGRAAGETARDIDEERVGGALETCELSGSCSG